MMNTGRTGLETQITEMLSLVAAIRENVILPDRFSQLEKVLCANTGLTEYYTDIVQMYVDLEFIFGHKCTVILPGQTKLFSGD